MNFYKNKELLSFLPHSGKKNIIKIFISSFISSIIDISVLYSLFPVVYLITHPELIEKNNTISWIYHTLNFSNHNSFLIFSFSMVVLAFAFRNMLYVYISNKQLTWAYQIGDIFFNKMNNYIFHLNISEFKKMGFGQVEHNIRQVPYQIAYLYLQPLSMVLTEFFVLIFLITIIVAFNFKLFLMLFLFVFMPVYLLYRLFKNKMAALGKNAYNLSIHLVNITKNNIRGYADIYLMHKQKYFIQNLLQSQQKYNYINKKISVIQQSFPRIIEWIAVTSVFVLFVFFQYTQMPLAEITLTITVYLTAAYRIMPSINRINASLLMMKQYEYLIDVFKKAEQHQPPPELTHSSSSIPLPFHKHIQLKNISLAYSEDKMKKVIDGVSLQINKSELLGIVGESGAGKSTLMYIIAGLLPIDSGEIYVDDTPIHHHNIAAWHTHIAIVFQEPYIIDGNWKDNIAFGEPLSDEDKIWECLKTVKLDDYVRRLPKQLNEYIGDSGAFLSGGQKQRLALARALYRNADVLLLDEATSALDEETQADVITAIEDIRKQKNITVIMIAHRFSSLKFCDRVIVMDKGKIIKETNYAQLITEK